MRARVGRGRSGGGSGARGGEGGRGGKVGGGGGGGGAGKSVNRARFPEHQLASMTTRRERRAIGARVGRRRGRTCRAAWGCCVGPPRTMSAAVWPPPHLGAALAAGAVGGGVLGAAAAAAARSPHAFPGADATGAATGRVRAGAPRSGRRRRASTRPSAREGRVCSRPCAAALCLLRRARGGAGGEARAGGEVSGEALFGDDETAPTRPMRARGRERRDPRARAHPSCRRAFARAYPQRASRVRSICPRAPEAWGPPAMGGAGEVGSAARDGTAGRIDLSLASVHEGQP